MSSQGKGRRRDADRARGRLRRGRRHPEQLAARDAGHELGALAVDVFGADRVSVSPKLADAIGEAIELAEAGPDDALGGSGVLVTGSVITAGEARTLLAGRRA